MKKIILNDIEYELLINEKDCFNFEEVEQKATDYFIDFDYIIGDYSYDKLRLKGFYDAKNKNVKAINNYDNKDDYLKNYCSFGCKYFVLKKVGNNN